MIADGGIGTYLRNLLPLVAASRPEWRFTLIGDPKQLLELATTPNVSVKRCGASIYGVREQFELPIRSPRDASVFWAPHYNIPLLLRGPRLVVTLHDVCHLALPRLTGGPVRGAYAKRMHAAVRRRAAAILFDSEFTRREMARLVGEPRCEGMVAHLGVDEAWLRVTPRASDRPVAEPYLVYVGNFKRHKNIPLLLRAFARVQDRIPHRLMLIGRREGLRADPDIGDALRVAGERTVVAGEIGGVTLRRYVSHADALVTTSLYEGFGLPPLEAMASGVPCLVSNAGSLPEICGDAALYCDPRDEANVASRLVEIATQPGLRRSLAQRGSERARVFTWSRCAATTTALLERALAARS